MGLSWRIPIILLDACCVLTLFASQRFTEILAAVPARFAISARVKRESLFVSRAPVPTPLDLQPSVDTGIITVWSLDTDAEMAEFVRLAGQLDDGEAETVALAVLRGVEVATDDRKARRVLQAHPARPRLHSTTSLVKHWADTTPVPPAEPSQALRLIQADATFRPGRNDPLRPWWESILPP